MLCKRTTPFSEFNIPIGMNFCEDRGWKPNPTETYTGEASTGAGLKN